MFVAKRGLNGRNGYDIINAAAVLPAPPLQQNQPSLQKGLTASLIILHVSSWFVNPLCCNRQGGYYIGKK